MKLAIIGAGNIGGATAIGLHKFGNAEITVTAAHSVTLEKFAAMGMNTCLDNAKAAEWADVVIIAVKPWLVKAVVSGLSASLNGQIVVSMAPGIPSSEFRDFLPSNTPLAYAIPNTAIEVGQSMTFISPITTSEKQTSALVELFSAAGEVMTVDENHLSAGTALASCGIAYALRYIRAASEGGVELGFPASQSEKIVAQTVKGAASVLAAHGTHPELEIDRVTTPGGLTIKGLNTMEENGFTNAVIKGLTANFHK